MSRKRKYERVFDELGNLKRINYPSVSVEVPEKYRALDDKVIEANRGKERFHLRMSFETGFLAFSSTCDESPELQQSFHDEARELMNEYKYLGYDAFLAQPTVSREVLYRALFMASNEGSQQRKKDDAKRRSLNGGFATADAKKADKQQKMSVTQAKYAALLGQGFTAKQAVLTLVERLKLSERTIYRHLSNKSTVTS